MTVDQIKQKAVEYADLCKGVTKSYILTDGGTPKRHDKKED